MNQEQIMKVLIAPIVSEKSTRLADENRQFVFKVVREASKPEVRKAVEEWKRMVSSGPGGAPVRERARLQFRPREDQA